MTTKSRKKAVAKETDSAYFLKILLYFMLGLIWLKLNGRPIVPLGLVVGLLISTHEHFQIDRKMEYAILLIATMLGIGGGIALNISF